MQKNNAVSIHECSEEVVGLTWILKGFSLTAACPSARNIKVAIVITPIGSKGNKGCRYGKSSSDRFCARNASRKRKDTMPMDAQTSRAEMPVRLINHVNTTPSSQSVVRIVRNDMLNATLKDMLD